MKEQAQPSTPFYDPSALYLVNDDGSPLERDATPADPPFVATNRDGSPRKVKRWNGSGSMFFFEGGQVVKVFVPLEEDGYNFLPIAYKPYVVADTVAVHANGVTFNANFLSNYGDAVALAKELGAGPVADDGAHSLNYGSETRRSWGFSLNGNRLNAGALLLAKNARGIGHPGHWDEPADGLPVWVSDPDPVVPVSGAAAWPIPCRELRKNELVVPFTVGMFGTTYRVQNTDLAGPAPVGGSGLTPLQEAKFDHAIDLATQNQAAIAKIAAFIGVPS